MATPLEGIDVIPNAIANALAPLYDSIVGGEKEVPWEYRFGEPGYRENLGGYYPAAPPLDVTNPYTETYRSDILPRTSEDFTKVITGPSGKYIQGYDVGAGPFAQVEQELLARQDERQRQVDSNTPTSYMTGATVKRYDGGLKETIHAPRIDFYPDNRTVFSGGVRQIIEPSFADQVEAERRGIQFKDAAQDTARAEWDMVNDDVGPIEPQENYIVDMAVDDLAATQNLQKQYPDAAWDLLQHYVRSKGLTEKYSPNMAKTLGLAQEAWNIPMPGQGGFSVDDLLANEAALQGLTPEEAYAAGAFSHTEEKGWKGRGQGIVSEAIKKAEAAGMDVPWTWNVYNRGTDWNVLDEVSELYEKASGGVSGAAEKLQDRIRETGIDFGELGRKAMDFFIPPADAIPAPVEEAGIRRPISPYAVSTGIGTDIVEPSPFISSPEVGDEEEEVSEERVKVIKKKPKEKRTSVEEQVVVASEVKKALDNASKGKKVKNELKAIVELAKVDPTIVKRYTTPGSQALQDITAQVDSFSFMPTIQKKKKTVDPWAFEDRRGGRR